MKDKAFIDTNIFVYAFLDSEKQPCHAKHLSAIELLKAFQSSSKVIVSAQVLSEYYSALLKNKIDDSEIQLSLQKLVNAINVVPLTKQTVTNSFLIRNRYHYSLWDSLIISSALEQGCTVLYSEDMHHDQYIDKQLRIINPFI